MVVLITSFILICLVNSTIAYPTSYPPAVATETTDSDPELPTPTYYQPINTAIDYTSQPVYYTTVDTSSPASSYINQNPPSYTTAPPPSPYPSNPTAPTSTSATDCPDPTDLYPSTTTLSTPSQTQTLTLTTPLVILPASPSSSSPPSPIPQTHCNKCCPQPPIEDENGRKGDWLSELGMLLAKELEEGVQGVVGRVEGRCGLLGGRGGSGHGAGGGGGVNATMITGCSVFAGGVICGWSWEGR